ncbi:AraC family transcriptional regulator ligand-binding domain-containing protein [Primorskyibacter sp. S87]|uniref:AraC family transcriptional regulator n=1 Tax=Primorskyibacter sp. S87 TaxID=3415126 RepID=UPI003C7ECF1A
MELNFFKGLSSMKRRMGSIHTVRARQLLQLVSDQGLDARELAKRAGLSLREAQSAGETMPMEKFVTLFEEAASLVNDDLLGFRFGQTRDPRDMGLLGYVGVSSPTVLSLFENTIRYQRILGSAMRFDISYLRNNGLFRWQTEPRNAKQYWEYNTANCLNQLRAATGVQIKPVRASFTHERANDRDEVCAYLGCPVEWSTDRNEIEFRPSDLSLGLKSSDQRLLSVLNNSAERVVEMLAEGTSATLTEIREVLAKQAAQGRPTSDAVASALGISNRTLSRRLATEGTDFRTLLDETREGLAREYLKDVNMSFGEIAYLLGFADPSSFSAACKRWTGKTPTELRKATLRQ